MPQPLRVLILEESSADAGLMVSELRQADLDPEWDRVATEQDFLERLESTWDLILADYNLDQFDARRALQCLRERGIDTPLIVVSGTIGEETAVAAMKEGATDCLRKDRLERLGPAVLHALEQRRQRKMQPSAIQGLLENRERTRLILDTAYDPFVAMDSAGRITEWNKQAEATFGWSRSEVIGKRLAETIIPMDMRTKHAAGLTRFVASGASSILNREIEVVALRRDGTEFPAELIVWPIPVEQGQAFCAFVRDISLRKQSETALRQRTQHIMLSADIGLALNRSAGLSEVLQQCAESLIGNLDLDLARIWTLEAGDILQLQASAGLDTRLDGPYQRVPLDEFKIGRIARDRAPYLTNDLPSDPHIGDREWALQEGLSAFAGHPLFVENRLVGVVAAFARRRLTPETLDALGTASNQIAAGIERKRTEERLQFTQFTIDHIATAVFWSNAEGRFFNVNDAACRLTGYTRDELLALHIYDLDQNITPDSWPRIWHDLQRRQVLTTESRLRRKNGTEIPISINSNLLKTEGHLCSCTFIQDIVERKAAEFAQRQSELRFRAIFHQTLELVGLLSADGTVLEVNQPALDFRRIRLADVAGLPWWETPWLDISAQAREQAREAVLRAAAGAVVRQELTVPDSRGDPRTFDFSLKPVVNEAGQVELLIVEARDITDQKRLEEQFRQAQKMEAVGKLAGGVAHDFNNLLTIILGYSDMLQETLRPDDPVRELIDEICKAGQRAAGLTRQLLAFSRKQVLVPVVLDLNVLVADMEKMLKRLIGEDLDLAFCPAADLWRVQVDAGQMEQVIMNLAVNARDAMPQGGKLTIETRNVELDEAYAAVHAEARAGEYILLAVTDTGCGMDKGTLAQIFEPFFTTKGPDRGTGLGLATVYGIVKQSGGHIAVYSELSRGTTFKIYLPRDRDGIAAPRPRTDSKMRLHGTETVLLVEDEEGVRTLARAILQHGGYKVLEACSGLEALQICEQYEDSIHLLATDVVMPSMSGRELADRLLVQRPETKVLYLSGYLDDAIVRHGLLNAGMPFLPKPYSPDALAQKVREVLDE